MSNCPSLWQSRTIALSPSYTAMFTTSCLWISRKEKKISNPTIQSKGTTRGRADAVRHHKDRFPQSALSLSLSLFYLSLSPSLSFPVSFPFPVSIPLSACTSIHLFGANFLLTHLVVGSRREPVSLLGGNHSVAVNQLCEHATLRLNAEGEGCHVEQQQVLSLSTAFSRENSALR